jgi:hypothetical protein
MRVEQAGTAWKFAVVAGVAVLLTILVMPSATDTSRDAELDLEPSSVDVDSSGEDWAATGGGVLQNEAPPHAPASTPPTGRPTAEASATQPAAEADASAAPTADPHASLEVGMGRPGWADAPGGMTRFQRAAAEVWRDRGDVTLRTLAGASLAQDKEDMYAYRRFFYERGGGTFMEMGALDGLRFSNT